MKQSKLIKRFRVDRPKSFKLAEFDPAETAGVKKAQAETIVKAHAERLGELQERLYAEDRWGTGLAIALAQVAGFGVLWLAKFLILDKVMWKIVHEIQPDVAIDEAEAGLVGALSLDGSDGEPQTPGQHRPNGAAPSTVEPSPADHP